MERRNQFFEIWLSITMLTTLLAFASPVIAQSDRIQKGFETKVKIATDGKASEGDSEAIEVRPEFDNEFFSNPELLMAGKNVLNKVAEQRYPAPAIYDIDNDGDFELIVGDVAGKLNVYENENSGEQAEPVWGEPEALKTAEGKELKVANW